MRKLVIACVILLALGLAAPPAEAGPILFEGLFYQDGAAGALSAAPAAWDLSGFNLLTGLGTITATATGLGLHSFGLFLDIEIDEAVNTFYNEYGTVAGAPGAGLEWEIDEPGYSFGDIYDNFVAGALDGTNGVPVGSPDDVSVALMWNVLLAADEKATLTWRISDIAPAGGFYLSQVDPDSGLEIYFQGDAEIRGETVPDPGGTLLLLGLGLAACVRGLRR